MALLEINGAKLWVEESGTGPETIVFAHGLLWSGEMYAPQVARLQARFRCVRFDFRGQGKSPVSDAGYDMDTLTGDTIALIERLQCSPCHFVGLSMGGFVGLRIAIRRPELLRSLTLIDTAADPEPRINVVKYGAMLALSRIVGLRPFTGTVMRTMFGDVFLRDSSRHVEREALRNRLLANDIVGVRRATQGIISRAAVTDQLGRITTRTQVLHGAGDRAITTERARRMASGIAGAKFHLIPRAGHTSTLEEPAAITDAIEAFVQS
jgi:3-oxoadipate enol-lactonase